MEGKRDIVQNWSLNGRVTKQGESGALRQKEKDQCPGSTPYNLCDIAHVFSLTETHSPTQGKRLKNSLALWTYWLKILYVKHRLQCLTHRGSIIVGIINKQENRYSSFINNPLKTQHAILWCLGKLWHFWSLSEPHPQPPNFCLLCVLSRALIAYIREEAGKEKGLPDL